MSAPVNVGRYQVLGELGRGAMGVVYRGRDPQLERTVAIKLIRLDAAREAGTLGEAEARFLREARVAARLQHPGVATVYDAGREGDGFFLVMELVEGESLASRLRRGEFPGAAAALELAAQVADALHAAHRAGVVHRDVKPANILLAPDGRVKVTDFGVAKAVGESTELTRSGTVLGSPAYMAPEQIQGQAVDGRADLFSLGVVLYELLLRRRPFPADTVTTLIYQILHQDPFADEAVLRALGPDLGALLRSALAKDPAQRVADAASFAARARALAVQAAVLRRAETAATQMLAAAEAPTLARPARPPVTTQPAVAAPGPVGGRGPLVGVAAAVLALALGATAAGYLLLRRPPPPRLAAAPTAAGVTVPSEGLGSRPAPAEAAETAAAAPAQPLMIGEPRPGRAVVAAAPAPSARPPVETPAATKAAPPGGSSTPPAPRPAPEPPPAVSSPAAAQSAEVAEAAAPGPPVAPPPVTIAETYECQQAAEFDLDPEDTEISIGGRRVGTSEELDGEPYVFPGPGTYDLELSRLGFHTTWIRIRVHPGAEDEIAEVDTELRKVRRR